MGTQYTAVCDECGTEFSVSEGGGMRFDLLRCELCGESTSVKLDDKGKQIEEAGSCACGGNFTDTAKPRYPKCKSTDYSIPNKDEVMYFD